MIELRKWRGALVQTEESAADEAFPFPDWPRSYRWRVADVSRRVWQSNKRLPRSPSTGGETKNSRGYALPVLASLLIASEKAR
jgi:hypothetical protein